MSETILLRILGEVQQPQELAFADLCQIAAEHQIEDVGQLVPGRRGSAVTLRGLLALAKFKPDAHYITVHASADDFHASVPLGGVLDTALVIYRDGDGPLPQSLGGPVRFLIPDAATCRTSDVDACANVKFVDQIELTRELGQDSRAG